MRRLPVLALALISVLISSCSFSFEPPPEGQGPECHPGFSLVPNPPRVEQALSVSFTDTTPWADTELNVDSSYRWTVQPTTSTGGTPYSWTFEVIDLATGPLTLAFTADKGAKVVGSCKTTVAP